MGTETWQEDDVQRESGENGNHEWASLGCSRDPGWEKAGREGTAAATKELLGPWGHQKPPATTKPSVEPHIFCLVVRTCKVLSFGLGMWHRGWRVLPACTRLWVPSPTLQKRGGAGSLLLYWNRQHIFCQSHLAEQQVMGIQVTDSTLAVPYVYVCTICTWVLKYMCLTISVHNYVYICMCTCVYKHLCVYVYMYI